MNDRRKAALLMGGVAALVGIRLATLGGGVPKGAEPAATMDLKIIPTDMIKAGRAIAGVANVVEGSSATIIATVKNLSTKAGAPIAVTLDIGMVVTRDDLVVLLATSKSANFAANQEKDVTFTCPTAAGDGGHIATASGVVHPPGDATTVLAQATGQFSIIEAPILYGASMVI